jgi:antitoxin component HigA of HigAB toxin-antitoxin module
MIKNELRSIMIKHGDSNQDLAAAIGISPQAVSSKLNGKRNFTLKDIKGIISRYALNPEDVQRIFFT